MKYTILMSFNLDKITKTPVDEVNKFMGEMGFEEKLILRSEDVPFGTLEYDEELRRPLVFAIEENVARKMNEKYPGANFVVRLAKVQ